MTTRRIDQNMATAAAAVLPKADTLKDQDKKALRTRYRQLGNMLHTAGLAATYAFIAARSSTEKDVLAEAYRQVAKGLRIRLADVGLLTTSNMGPREVLEALGAMSAVDYARASAEAAALTRWLSRLADATYQVEQTG